ncbi:alanine racemase [Dietzia sp. NCCP-2495]|uniref:alanine racemase n=1 Tax=Dietzia sp. NCCP-2495 TaxID=2934675 RepID=UPI00222F93CC|nr:alanine racemase [Dietzia sp. NCCP-2495]GLB65008.1 alanine racemase [Dietzia sp. NCCP-2495]
MAPNVPPAPCRAEIDLDAVEHNARVLVDAAQGARVMAVVKADAYGHGAVAVSLAALRGGADALGVTTIAEALELREAGITAEILAWIYLPSDDVRAALEADVDLAVPSPAHLDTVIQAARRTGLRARVTPKIDTGLARSGITPEDWPEVLTRLVAAEAGGLIEVTGLMAHFAHADDPGNPVIDQQVARLHEAVEQARAAGLACPVNHHANSAATLTRPDDGFEMVRPGIALYGLDPVGDLDVDLRPVMSFTADILMIKRLSAGQGVSYGHTWHAPHDTTVALISAGYADGVWRILSGQIDVEIGGVRYPNVGRVCMDQFVVDLGPTPDPTIRAGDTAVLFGDGTNGGPTAAEWADKLGTIHYEVVTAVRGRARRHVLGRHAGGDKGSAK